MCNVQSVTHSTDCIISGQSCDVCKWKPMWKSETCIPSNGHQGALHLAATKNKIVRQLVRQRAHFSLDLLPQETVSS